LCRFLAATLLTLVIGSVAIATVGLRILSDPTVVEGWLSILSMLAIQLTIVATMDIVVYLILLFPGSLAKPFALRRLEAREGDPP